MPHTMRTGTMGFLEQEAVVFERALTNKEARPHPEVLQGPDVVCVQPACLHQQGGLQGSALGDGERHQ